MEGTGKAEITEDCRLQAEKREIFLVTESRQKGLKCQHRRYPPGGERTAKKGAKSGASYRVVLRRTAPVTPGQDQSCQSD